MNSTCTNDVFIRRRNRSEQSVHCLHSTREVYVPERCIIQKIEFFKKLKELRKKTHHFVEILKTKNVRNYVVRYQNMFFRMGFA
jgi:predicted site-specific integrase-resolvase